MKYTTYHIPVVGAGMSEVDFYERFTVQTVVVDELSLRITN